MPGNKGKFKCTIRSVHSTEPVVEGLELDLVEHIHGYGLLRIFRSKIREQYEIKGDITVWRSKKDSGKLIPGQEIKDLTLTVAENETIFVLFDDQIEVVPGGWATGAKGQDGLAMGGNAGGGQIKDDGYKMGGFGLGGDLIGPRAVGEGGEGHGGPVDAKEAGGAGGAAAGGDVLRRHPNSSPAGGV